jgi:hypothetical protein
MTDTQMAAAAILESPFRLDSLEAVPAPLGCEGIWQRYVITQGANTIVGMRAGTHSEVSVVLTQYVERLNERFAKQRSRAAK